MGLSGVTTTFTGHSGGNAYGATYPQLRDGLSTGFTPIISGFSGGCKFFGGTEEILQMGQLRYLCRPWATGRLTSPAGVPRFPAWELPPR